MLNRSHIYAALVAFALFTVGVPDVNAQMISGTDTRLGGVNSITGTVITTSGRVTSHVAIRLITNTRGDIKSTSDDFGNFAFRGLTSGDYIIAIDKEKDFEPFTTTVSVIQPRGFPPQTYNISCRLKPKPGIVPVRPVVLNAELAGIPPAALAFYKKGGELAAKDDHAGAIEQFKLAINEYPKFSSAYNDMGVQYLKLKDVPKAMDAYRTAMNMAPDAFAPRLNLGMLMVDIQKFDEAEKTLRSAVVMNEGSAAAHYFLGRALANLGKFDEAIVELNKGLELGGEATAPGMREAYRILGIIYSSKGEKKRAAAQFEKYLELNPTAPDAEQLRAVIQQLKSEGNPPPTSNPKSDN